MEIYSHPDIAEILTKEGNNFCCDCHAPKPKWSSMNNGVFLCLKCAGIHRSFGLNISLIRSLQIDQWDNKQILYLSKGGNMNFLQNLKEFNIPENAAFELKYKTKAAEYYRQKLHEEVEKLCDVNYVVKTINRPDLTEGLEPLPSNENTNDVDNNNIISNYNAVENVPESTGPQNKIFGFMNNVFGVVKEAAGTVTQKMEEIGITEKLKAAGEFFSAKTKEAYNSEVVQGFKKKAEEGLNSVVDKGKELLGVPKIREGEVVGRNDGQISQVELGREESRVLGGEKDVNINQLAENSEVVNPEEAVKSNNEEKKE